MSLLRLLLLGGLLVACGACTKPCRDDTLSLQLDLTAVSTADSLEVITTIDGEARSATTPYQSGHTLEVQFAPGAFPGGKTISVVVVARLGADVLGRATQNEYRVPASCGALSLVFTAAACDSGDQCDTGFCVDGVCCDTACDGQCEACDRAGNVGICGAITDGAPHGSRAACAGAGTTCGGVCTSASRGACTYPNFATMCSEQSCSGNTKSLLAGCDQKGACTVAETVTCAQGCDGDDCLGACTEDLECANATPSTPYCDNGACTEKLPRGRACTDGNECTSTFCADGVCCNSECADQCTACNEAGAVGTCSIRTGPVLTGSVPARTECGGVGLCGGACDGTSLTCTFGEPSCTGKVCGDDGCGGSCGTCSGTMPMCNATQAACVCTPKPSSSSYRRVFASHLGHASVDIGSAAGADTLCQNYADAAGLGGGWRAWLSDESSSPSTRFTQPAIPYVLLDGSQIASSWTNLIDATLDHAINVTEKCAAIGSAEVWTGTTIAGASTGHTCNGFTSGSAADQTTVGSTSKTNYQWTSVYSQFCNRKGLKLYCFEQ